MPELPEVETLCRQLAGVVTGKIILKCKVVDSKIGAIGHLAGRRILSAERRGKALVLLLDDDGPLTLHLRMTGRLLWQTELSISLPHTRFTMSFAEGSLSCIDPRRFATFTQGDRNLPGTSVLDPLRDCRIEQLCLIARNRRLPLKSFLMDQRFIAGIGNIYACEILHACAMSPWRRAGSLSTDEWRSLMAAAKWILSRAVACRGTTVSDWRDLFGEPGAYQHELCSYAREGQACSRCHGTIQRSTLNGRGTYFCPSCQK